MIIFLMIEIWSYIASNTSKTAKIIKKQLQLKYYSLVQPKLDHLFNVTMVLPLYSYFICLAAITIDAIFDLNVNGFLRVR